MSQNKLQLMAEITLFAALAFMLDIFTQPLKAGPWISLSFKMTPIFLLSLRRGTKAGVTAGFIWGLLQVITGQASILTPLQGFLEYFLAFSLIGTAGFVKPWTDRSQTQGKTGHLLFYSLLACALGGISRYLIHFVAGIVFWSDYAPEGTGAVIYSLTINGLSLLGESVASGLVIFLLLPFMGFFLTASKR